MSVTEFSFLLRGLSGDAVWRQVCDKEPRVISAPADVSRALRNL